MPDWSALTERSLREIEHVEPIYRPTNFWQPGLRALLDDLGTRGLETFKSWPTAGTWFYPRYWLGFTDSRVDETHQWVEERFGITLDRGALRAALNGSYRAQRQFDAARLAWDGQRWPFEPDVKGESPIGRPWQGYRLVPDSDVRYTVPYLNYLSILAGLSQCVDRPPRSFLEIGGGFGVLGEIVLSHDPGARYVDLDIPPLLTVASYYLTELFGPDRVAVDDVDEPRSGPVAPAGSAVLPNWRVRDLRGQFDVFVNGFSFQEMEPEVVEHYATAVADLGVTYVASLNSRLGKPRASRPGEWGAIDPVSSARIIDMFEARGYRLVKTFAEPLLRSAAELAILRRD